MLETVFSVNHQYHNRILYDAVVGEYYDAHTDLYLTLEQAYTFGLPR
jgi:hypothetical protein